MPNITLILKITGYCIVAAILIIIASLIIPVFLIAMLPIFGYGTYLMIREIQSKQDKNDV